MYKVITVYIMLTLCSRIMFAQTGTLEGTLFNKLESKGFAYNATVSLPALDKGAISNADGYFIIINVPVGIYEVKIESIGYRDTTISQVAIVDGKTAVLNLNFPIGCHFQNQKGKDCPYCHKEDAAVPLVYGLPSAKTLRMAKRKEIQLAGCVATGCDPQWYCKRDEKEF